MKAWERERKITDQAIPRILDEEEQTWDLAFVLEENEDNHTKVLWKSNVPGSFAPESIMTAAVQSKENMGYIVENSGELLNDGFNALEQGDMVELHKATAKLWLQINKAKIDEESSYWKYKNYRSWEEYVEAIEMPVSIKCNKDYAQMMDSLNAGWISQIIGGAMGTAIEGYTTENIRKTFGEINDYVRKPNTFNDDITYELAFLKAYSAKGREITSEDIALEWVGLIPSGWSAEEIALRNIRYGIFPPASGSFCNPFSDWIGAQMRGAICGMVAPGDPGEAARLAWIDGSVSHSNNGILGEIFNAALVSQSFIENDIRKILRTAMDMIPKDSEYWEIIDFAYTQCNKYEKWESAWKECEKRLRQYNWIHAYPNAAAEVVALWYGEGDFDKTINIIAMAGQDVDCNAAQIMSAIGIIIGTDRIPARWKDPIGDNLDTYVRTMKKMSISKLTEWTYECMEKAQL
ncbi:MAG: ADP-ribosylglycohydrolase family protein [Eubacteriales bacterium]